MKKVRRSEKKRAKREPYSQIPKQETLRKRLRKIHHIDQFDLRGSIWLNSRATPAWKLYRESKSFREFQIFPNRMQFAETEFRRSTKVCYIQRFRKNRSFRYHHETCSTTCQSGIFSFYWKIRFAHTCMYSKIINTCWWCAILIPLIISIFLFGLDIQNVENMWI